MDDDHCGCHHNFASHDPDEPGDGPCEEFGRCVDCHEGAHEAGSSTLIYWEGCPQCEQARALNTPE